MPGPCLPPLPADAVAESIVQSNSGVMMMLGSIEVLLAVVLSVLVILLTRR